MVRPAAIPLLLLTFAGCATAPSGRAAAPAPRPAAPEPVAAPAPPHPGFAAVAAGASHTCALRGDGRVSCWGDDSVGQLGDGARTPATATPRLVPGLSEVVRLASAARHSCALRRTGEVWCWGGVFGPSPLRVAGIEGAVDVAVGPESCAVLGDGTVRCWSGDASPPGALPLAVAVEGIDRAVEVGVGSHACARRRDGRVLCWGDNAAGQLGDGGTRTRRRSALVPGLTDAIGLAVGAEHTCALRADGRVLCWGLDRYGQLGDGQSGLGPRHSSNAFRNRPFPVEVEGLDGVRAIAAGGHVTCALTEGGRVSCWGHNAYGQLGVEVRAPEDAAVGAVAPHVSRPVAVADVEGIAQLSVGGQHTCALSRDRALRCWGLNATGALGVEPVLARPSPVRVQDLQGVVDVALGHGYSCAQTDEGGVVCWGGFEPRFDPDMNRNRVFVPVTGRPIPVQGLSDVEAITTGIAHGCALRTDGTVRCWGRNETAQVARRRWSGLRYAATRVPIRGVAGLNAGGFHTCAVQPGGRLRCWGGVNGRVAGNTLSPSPTLVPGLRGVRQVASGRRHTCVLRENGAVACWGDNWFGALGPGVRAAPGARTERPVTVTGIPPAVEVSVGEHHSCARADDGSVRCWGGVGHATDEQGMLVPEAHPEPTPVPGITDAAQVACGGSHTCVRREGGDVMCFGANHRGQVGDGTRDYRPTPVRAPLPGPAMQIATGATHACARLADGILWCWGDNRAAEIGDGTVAYSSRPILVLPEAERRRFAKP